MEFLSLVVVVMAAFLTPILINRLRITFLPVVVAEILMGILIGPVSYTHLTLPTNREV